MSKADRRRVPVAPPPSNEGATLTCRMCLEALPSPGGGKQGADPYRRCPHCGGLLLAPYPTAQRNELFEGLAAAREFAALETAREQYFLRHLSRVERQMDDTVQAWRLLEVGCGSGVLLRAARDRGWHADGLEMSSELAEIARDRNPGAEVICANICTARDGHADYDAVLALDVIEHVLEPEKMLRSCWSHLRPGGLLLLQTPNVKSLRHGIETTRWEMRDPDQHVNLFSPGGLRGLLGRTGFAVSSFQTVSGSGLETGWRRVAARAKEAALGRLGLGNALCVLARRT